jgi:hypothetical protein
LPVTCNSTPLYTDHRLFFPAPLSQYTIYNTPDPAFITGRISVSGFANLAPALRGRCERVPLNGHVACRGQGPFRSLFLRRQSSVRKLDARIPLSANYGITLELSPRRLCELSERRQFRKNDDRSPEHLRQFRTWNNTATHPRTAESTSITF